jgi:hypothetical protein
MVKPDDLDGRTKEGKAWKAEADASGLPVVTGDQMNCLRRMLDRMPSQHRELASLPTQLVGRIDAGDGWHAQCKLDLFDERGGRVIDIKTTSAPLEQWPASAWRYGYHVQAGWYRWVMSETGMDRLPFGFMVTETVCPWRTSLFWSAPDFLVFGDERAEVAAGIISQGMSSGVWGSGFPAETMLSAPSWV